MTKKEFENRYCKRSNITLDYYHKEFVTLPCSCDFEDCKGWACVTSRPINIKAHNELYRHGMTEKEAIDYEQCNKKF